MMLCMMVVGRAGVWLNNSAGCAASVASGGWFVCLFHLDNEQKLETATSRINLRHNRGHCRLL